MKRREFLRTIGISSTATAAACSVDPLHWDPMVPMEKAYPYLIQPEEVVPGVSSFYATRCGQCDSGCGVVARVREGRVVKLEGNNEHPQNKGRLCSNGQSSLLDSYTPDRFDGPEKSGEKLDWETAVKGLADVIQSNNGKTLWVGRYRSGASKLLLEQFAQVNNIDVHLWEPDGKEAIRAAVQQVFGKSAKVDYKLAETEVILSFGLDFLGHEGSITIERGWADSRTPDNGIVSKTYTVGPRIGMTEATTDKHLRCKIGSEAGIAYAIAKKLSEKVGYSGPAQAALNTIQNPDKLLTDSNINIELVETLIDELSNAKLSVVFPGGMQTSSQPTELQIAALLINEVAGNIGRSILFEDSDSLFISTAAKLKDAIIGGKYTSLIVDGVDLAYDFSSSSEFVTALGEFENLYAFENEPNATTALSNATILPPGTTLERWGDGNENSGIYSLQQAIMDPMQRPEGQQRDIRSVEDVLLTIAKAFGQKAIVATPTAEVGSTDNSEANGTYMADAAEIAPETEGSNTDDTIGVQAFASPLPDLDSASFQDYIHTYWVAKVYPMTEETNIKSFWVSCLKRGGFFGDRKYVDLNWGLQSVTITPVSDDNNLIVFNHSTIGKARNANRSWLQEVADPMSDFSWATWVEVSKGTAERLGLTKDKGIEITSSNGHAFTAGWQMSPGIADDTFAISSAGGQINRGRYAKVAAENGGSCLSLIDFNTDAFGAVQYVGNATIKASSARNAPSPRNKLLKSDTLTMNDRGANFTVYKGDLGTKEGASAIVPMHRLPDSSMAIRARTTKNRFDPEDLLTDMYPEPEHPVHRFVMAFDLNRCNGCGACEIACYAENNIPVTGPEEARLGRRMSWDRLAVFWEGDGETPDIRFQPNTCQQCSHAPCEGVCPVLATYHNIDGLNAMIYNRCVGTRYCGNNCPYSSRRFNYHTYRWPESFNLMLNPDVMTREMGVMEKCTFCVQRIRAAKDEHRDNVGFDGQGTAVPEDKLLYLTACSQTCPTDAIRFGNLKDKESAVAKAFEEPRGYKLLEELNTKPAIVYLARIVHEKSEQWEHSFGHHHGGGHGDGHGSDNGHHGEEHNGTESNGH